MNKAVKTILKQLAREAARHPEVRRQAEKLATLASRKAIEIAEGTSQWLRDRTSKMQAAREAENRPAPARKKTAKKSSDGKKSGKKASGSKKSSGAKKSTAATKRRRPS